MNMNKTNFFVLIGALSLGVLTGCKSAPVMPESVELSKGHLSESSDKRTNAPDDIPAVGETVTAPPITGEAEDLFSIVVTDVPARKVLFAIARDAQVNIDVHPTIEGNISLNAIDQTLTQILDRISKQVEVRYRITGDLITVVPDTPYITSYDVNYLNMTRSSLSLIHI